MFGFEIPNLFLIVDSQPFRKHKIAFWKLVSALSKLEFFNYFFLYLPLAAAFVVTTRVSWRTLLAPLILLLISLPHPIPKMLDGCLCTDCIGMVIPSAAAIDRQRMTVLPFGISQLSQLVVDVS